VDERLSHVFIAVMPPRDRACPAPAFVEASLSVGDAARDRVQTPSEML
jgi:hypothetical protein